MVWSFFYFTKLKRASLVSSPCCSFHLTFIVSSFSCECDRVEEGKYVLQSYGRTKIKEENCFDPTYTNNFQVTDPLAAKMLQEICFRHTHVFLLLYSSNKNKRRVGKGNKHLLSQALNWVLSIT